MKVREGKRSWRPTFSPGWGHSPSPVSQGSYSGSFSLPFWPRPPGGASEGCRGGCRSGPSDWPGGCPSSSLCSHWRPSPGSWRSRWCGSHWTAGSCRKGMGRLGPGRGSAGCRLGWSRSLLGTAYRWEPAGQSRGVRRGPPRPHWPSQRQTLAPQRSHHLDRRNSLTLKVLSTSSHPCVYFYKLRGSISLCTKLLLSFLLTCGGQRWSRGQICRRPYSSPLSLPVAQLFLPDDGAWVWNLLCLRYTRAGHCHLCWAWFLGEKEWH